MKKLYYNLRTFCGKYTEEPSPPEMQYFNWSLYKYPTKITHFWITTEVPNTPGKCAQLYVVLELSWMIGTTTSTTGCRNWGPLCLRMSRKSTKHGQNKASQPTTAWSTLHCWCKFNLQQHIYKPNPTKAIEKSRPVQIVIQFEYFSWF